MKTIYFDKNHTVYIPRYSFINEKINRFIIFISVVHSNPWKADLFDENIKIIKNQLVRLQKKNGYAILTTPMQGEQDKNPYVIELQKLKQVLNDWYRAIEKQSVGILLVFDQDNMLVIPDIEAIGEDELVKQVYNQIYNQKRRTESKFWVDRIFEDNKETLRTISWPDDMSEEVVMQKQQEALDYIKMYNIKAFWDPYTKTLNYHGYTKDGMLILFIHDDDGDYLTDFPILL